MTISDVHGDSFDGREVEEQKPASGSNQCYWTGSGIVQDPEISGGVWTVAAGDVAGQHNHWGYDYIGYVDPAVLTFIRTNGPAHGVSIPCTASYSQRMLIFCDANTNYSYRVNVLTVTVEASDVKNCRAGVCQTISR
jgi:hypothetical protein